MNYESEISRLVSLVNDWLSNKYEPEWLNDRDFEECLTKIAQLRCLQSGKLDVGSHYKEEVIKLKKDASKVLEYNARNQGGCCRCKCGCSKPAYRGDPIDHGIH